MLATACGGAGGDGGGQAVPPDEIETPVPVPIPGPDPTDGEAPVASPTALNFGGVPVGVTGTRTLQLSNLGAAALNVVLQIAPADAPFEVTPSATELAAGATATLTVRFIPVLEEAAAGQLRLSGSDATLVSLAGVGAPAPNTAIVPSSTTCLENAPVGELCDLTLAVLANAAEVSGFSLNLRSRRYGVRTVTPAGLSDGRSCLMSASSETGGAIVAGVCETSFEGNGAFVVLRLERMEGGAATFTVNDGLLLQSDGNEIPTAGGSLVVP